MERKAEIIRGMFKGESGTLLQKGSDFCIVDIGKAYGPVWFPRSEVRLPPDPPRSVPEYARPYSVGAMKH